jgi:hypothetical protein
MRRLAAGDESPFRIRLGQLNTGVDSPSARGRLQ